MATLIPCSYSLHHVRSSLLKLTFSYFTVKPLQPVLRLLLHVLKTNCTAQEESEACSTVLCS
uniref:Uncharacterized protein n=1 Tax=Anguilla anguilla TaxID=7936 RepID=A0A0E9UP21_ANGAN